MRVAVQNEMQVIRKDAAKQFRVTEVLVVFPTTAIRVVVYGSNSQPPIKLGFTQSLFEPVVLPLFAQPVMTFVRTVFGVHRSVMALIHGGVEPGHDNAQIFVHEQGPRRFSVEGDSRNPGIEFIEGRFEMFPLREPREFGFLTIPLAFEKVRFAI